MQNPRPGEENIIKDIRNLLRQEKKLKHKDRILKDIENLLSKKKKIIIKQ